jgi:hypothetical protein
MGSKKTSVLAWTSVVCVSIGVALTQIASCGSPTYVVQQYAGPVRSRESIAVIRIHGADEVQPVALDRERLSPVEPGVRLHIEVLPGSHEIDVAASGQVAIAQRLKFVAEAGKLYRVILSQTFAAGAGGARAPRVHEVDPSTEAPIRIVSSAVTTETPVERPRAAGAAPAVRDGGGAAPIADAGSDAPVRD